MNRVSRRFRGGESMAEAPATRGACADSVPTGASLRPRCCRFPRGVASWERRTYPRLSRPKPARRWPEFFGSPDSWRVHSWRPKAMP